MKEQFFIYASILVIFASCCKAECITADVMISFEKLKARDTDSVLVIMYRPGTSFSVQIDSTWTYTPVSIPDTSNSGLVKSIPGHVDSKIFLSSLNKAYLFTGYELENINCACEGNKTQVVRSFFLNSVRKQGNNVALD